MKKILIGLVLSLMMAANMFATDLRKILTYESESMGTCNVYFDLDATEPFDIKNESIKYFLVLQDTYKEVEVFVKDLKCVEDEDDEGWKVLRDFAVEYNCYNIFIECENWYDAELRINIDGSVTVYVFSGFLNPEEE